MMHPISFRFMHAISGSLNAINIIVGRLFQSKLVFQRDTELFRESCSLFKSASIVLRWCHEKTDDKRLLLPVNHQFKLCYSKMRLVAPMFGSADFFPLCFTLKGTVRHVRHLRLCHRRVSFCFLCTSKLMKNQTDLAVGLEPMSSDKEATTRDHPWGSAILRLPERWGALRDLHRTDVQAFHFFHAAFGALMPFLLFACVQTNHVARKKYHRHCKK